jgi:DNA-binding NarL/FixJ family response regulator
MSAEQFQLLIVAVVAGVALLLGLRQLLVNRRLQRELSELQRELDNRSAAQSTVSKTSFSASLDQVERQQSVATVSQRSSTEKYRYVASLAAEGMDARAIASVLQISTAEVEQLLHLARLKHLQ